MGNGLDTLSYSPSEMDKLIVKMDDNIEWVNNPEFQETRKILNLIKNKLSEGGSVTDEYNDWSKYLLSSIKNTIVNNKDNNESDNDSKNLVEKKLEDKLKQEGFYLDNDDTSLNNGLIWMSNNGKVYKRRNTNN